MRLATAVKACGCWTAALAVACAAPAARAQSASPNLAGIAHVAIRVSDLDRTRAFFHKLGFEEAFAMNSGGAPGEAFFKVNDRQFIELYPRHGSDDAVGFMHICYEATDIHAVHDDYVAHGLAPIAVRRAGAGNLLFTLQGPAEPGPPSDLRNAQTENIEYTQYLPGSKHTLDRGKHLGPDRIAESIAGVGIPVSNLQAATEFYEQKLSFQPAARPLEPGHPALLLPGGSGERVELLSGAPADRNSLPFRLIFGVTNLQQTNHRLRQLGFSVEKHAGERVIHDPDGDAIAFILAGGSAARNAR